MTTPDPFAADPIERDGHGRPKIIPLKKRGGQPDLKAKLVPYTRVSTFANALDDGHQIKTWALRINTLSLGRNEELAAMAGVFGPTLDDCSTADKAELDRIIETAHNRAGGDYKANHGSAIHGMTEPDRDPFVPVRMRESVDSYNALLAAYGIEVVSSEEFVVCDELQVAGTFDHAYKFTRDVDFGDGLIIPVGTVVIGDKKTGSLHFDSQAVQLAIYAHGKLHDPVSGTRMAHNASLQYGILAHIPKWSSDGPVPPAALYLIDLTKGWAAAKLAAQVRAHRSDKTLGRPFPTLDVEPAVKVSLQMDASGQHLDEARQDVDPFDEPSLTATELQEELAASWEAEQAAPPVAHSTGIAASLTARPPGTVYAEIEATEAAIVAARAELAELESETDAWQSVNQGGQPVEPVSTPIPDFQPDDPEEEILAALTAGLGAELIEPPLPISTQLERCKSRDELAAVWRANKTAWTPMHTDVLKLMAKQFPEPLPA